MVVAAVIILALALAATIAKEEEEEEEAEEGVVVAAAIAATLIPPPPPLLPLIMQQRVEHCNNKLARVSAMQIKRLTSVLDTLALFLLPMLDQLRLLELDTSSICFLAVC
jgi:hypothetical protein